MRIVVERAFVLTDQDGRAVPFAVGEHDVPREIADHWYVLAHARLVDESEAETAPVKRGPGRPRKEVTDAGNAGR